MLQSTQPVYIPRYTNCVGFSATMGKNKLKEIREALDWTQHELAEKIGTSYQNVSHWENGTRNIAQRYLLAISEVTGRSVDEILGLDQSQMPKVQLMGYVGAGAEVFPHDDYMKGDGLEKLEMPISGRINIPAKEILAVRVKGESMMPVIQDGWVIYFHAVNCMEKCLRKLCVIKIKNGACYVKEMRRGTKPGHYMLLSYNAAPMEDVQIEWAYRILSIEPC